jgi:ketosteroid isomerase-like protein
MHPKIRVLRRRLSTALRNRDRRRLLGIRCTSAPPPVNATPQARQVPRPARTPEELHAAVEEAFNRGDLDACIGVYEDDATLVVPPDGRVAHGRDAIRAATAPLFAPAPRMTMTVLKKLEGGGLALTQGRWELAGTAADGSLLQLSGRGTMVSRRRPDGTWGIVLDDPLSGGDR